MKALYTYHSKAMANVSFCGQTDRRTGQKLQAPNLSMWGEIKKKEMKSPLGYVIESKGTNKKRINQMSHALAKRGLIYHTCHYPMVDPSSLLCDQSRKRDLI